MILTKRGWLGYFFGSSLQKKRNFYWAMTQSMLIVRNKGRTLVLEIPLPYPPYLVQKYIDISHLSHEEIIGSLLYITDHYDNSFSSLRNKEQSVRFLSFVSFIQLLLSPTKKTTPMRKPLYYYHANRPLVSYIMSVLQFYGIYPSKQPSSAHYYSISQLSTVV